MNRLLNWLEEEARGRGIMKLIIWCVILGFSWSIIFVTLMEFAGIGILSSVDPIEITNWQFLLIFVASPLLEEIFFRLVFLALAVIMWGVSGWVLLTAVASSLGFGYLHGGGFHIFTQGVFGILLCILFLKCGGFQKKYLKATATATAAHFLNNCVGISILLVTGKVF